MMLLRLIIILLEIWYRFIKIKGYKKFNYFEIYDKGVLKAKKVILDDNFDVYHDVD